MWNKMIERRNSLSFLLNTLERWDPYTFQHSRRVAGYAFLIARSMNFNSKSLRGIFLGALLHDVGKAGIQKEILRQPGKLSPDQRLRINAHPVIGARILGSTNLFADIVHMVLLHHERPDGSGYPFGLKGRALPMEVRVLAAADTFDALTTDRPYRAGLSFKSAADIIEMLSKDRLDTVTVKHFHPIISSVGTQPK